MLFCVDNLLMCWFLRFFMNSVLVIVQYQYSKYDKKSFYLCYLVDYSYLIINYISL